MTKKGFKPKWTTLHTKRDEGFQKYLDEGKLEVVSDHGEFMKWAYGKQS